MSEPGRDAEAAAPPAEEVAAWGSIQGLVHAFYGRAGGHSSDPWVGLNLSEKVGDDPEAVRTNWRRVAAAFDGMAVVRMHQVHGATVREAGAAGGASPGDEGGEDGLLSGESGRALAVMTADCVPILMVAPARRAVMALHAGWRGTLAGIAAAGLDAGRRLGIAPEEWQAALGPSIGGCCYEVSAAIGADLENRWGSLPDAWQPAGQRGQLDLRGANRAILIRHGVPEDMVFAVGPCTACDHSRYFSHRQSGGRTGRQASLIGFRRPTAQIDVVTVRVDR